MGVSLISPCVIKKVKYSFRTVQLMLVLYIMCVRFRGSFCAKALRMAIYISSLDLCIANPIVNYSALI